MGKNRKKLIIFSGGSVLLAAIICTVLFFINRKEEYRTIQIYKIEGSAAVDRDGVGSIDAYDGMMMQSGDTVCTDKESCLYFKMDEDKFALLEPESTVRMEASGTSTDSRTTFYLESGALVSRLDSKLSPKSVYEVNTPNSTMAVRGTIFRIEVTYDENGVSYTNVYVFDGTVECRLIFADGSVDEEAKQVQKGVLIRIRGDNTTSEYILDNGTVDYGQLPAEVLRFLKAAIEEGNELPVSKEELEAAIAEKSEAAIAEIEKDPHEHSGGTATCISPAICSSEDCGQAYGEKDAVNHTGGTEIRNRVAADCSRAGYTGDTYCLGCGEMIQAGSMIEKDATNHVGGTETRGSIASTCAAAGYTGDTYCLGCGKKLHSGRAIEKDTANHVGGTEIRGSVTSTCETAGYTGDTYCLGCGKKLHSGRAIEKDTANHVGGTEIRKSVAADCCKEGYTGDTYCLGCNTMLEKGEIIAATGNHPAAVCGAPGHHAHDGKIHAIANCGISGHCILDGKSHELAGCGIHCILDGGNNHIPASCKVADHYECYGDHGTPECGEAEHCISDGRDHNRASCNNQEHHNCDGFDHTSASCGVEGHYNCDGLDHTSASCGIEGHYNCDDRPHGENCNNPDFAS